MGLFNSNNKKNEEREPLSGGVSSLITIAL